MSPKLLHLKAAALLRDASQRPEITSVPENAAARSRAGLWKFYSNVLRDPDFTSLRDSPEFQAILANLRRLEPPAVAAVAAQQIQRAFTKRAVEFQDATAREHPALTIRSSSSPDAKQYQAWVIPYLYFFDDAPDQRYHPAAGVSAQMAHR